MKSLIGTCFLVLTVFRNSLGQPKSAADEPVEIIDYDPTRYLSMKILRKLVSNNYVPFDDRTSLVKRDETVFGWFDRIHHNQVLPIFDYQGKMVTYDLRTRKRTERISDYVAPFGLFKDIDVLLSKSRIPRPTEQQGAHEPSEAPLHQMASQTHPIRTFQYRPAPFFNILFKKINNERVAFDEDTTLVARDEMVFGWLHNGVIQPIIDKFGMAFAYDWAEKKVEYKELSELKRMGLFTEFPPRPRNLSPRSQNSAQSPPRSRTRSPSK